MPTGSDVHYLGRVTRAPRRGDSYNWASVEPLVESDAEGTRWFGPVTNAISRFPRRGLVHWHDAPPTVQLGSLWQFLVDEHPTAEHAERAVRPEQNQLVHPEAPIEVLDLRSWKDNSAVRSAITGEGMPLPVAPLARRVFLWLESGECVGPLLLKQGATPGLWALDAPEVHRDAARMPVHRLSNDEINRVAIEGDRWFVSPRFELPRATQIQNWTSDSQVTRSILGRLRKMDPDLVRAVGETDARFREYLERVENGQFGSTDPAVERARADRLCGIRDAIQRDVALLKEAAEVILAIDPVRAEVDRLIELKIAEEVKKRQVEIDAAVASATEELAALQREIVTKLAAIAKLDESLRLKKLELRAQGQVVRG